MKCQRTTHGGELQLARQTIVLAARAAGIDALDTVYSDVNNEEQLLFEARLIKDLGFDGKSVINPRQIAPVHSVFNPTQKDIDNWSNSLARGMTALGMTRKDFGQKDRGRHQRSRSPRQRRYQPERQDGG